MLYSCSATNIEHWTSDSAVWHVWAAVIIVIIVLMIIINLNSWRILLAHLMHHLVSTSFYEMWSPRQFNEVENEVFRIWKRWWRRRWCWWSASWWLWLHTRISLEYSSRKKVLEKRTAWKHTHTHSYLCTKCSTK